MVSFMKFLDFKIQKHLVFDFIEKTQPNIGATSTIKRKLFFFRVRPTEKLREEILRKKFCEYSQFFWKMATLSTNLGVFWARLVPRIFAGPDTIEHK